MPGTAQPSLTPAAGLTTPTRSFAFPPQGNSSMVDNTPTPDVPHYETANMQNPGTYIVRAGDMLSAIAMDSNVSVEALAQANGITDPNTLEVGQSLTIPIITPQAIGPSFKLIPDSELVYGPLSGLFDLEVFIEEQGGYLASYTEDVKGETLTGAQIVDLVARSDSVNPRLLLALLEYCTGWVTTPVPDPSVTNSPFHVNDGFHEGLYLEQSQLCVLPLEIGGFHSICPGGRICHSNRSHLECWNCGCPILFFTKGRSGILGKGCFSRWYFRYILPAVWKSIQPRNRSPHSL
jgi:LysM repeat protein